MKSMRIAAGLLAGALVVASCGSSSDSSDTTERTRNATLPSETTTVAFISTNDSTIYKMTMGTSDSVVLEKVLTDLTGTNIGITGLAVDTYRNKMIWATQDGSDAKIRTADIGSTSASTVYTRAGGYPLGLSSDTANDVVTAGFVHGGTTSVYVGDSLGNASSTVIASASGVRGIASVTDEVFGLSGTFLYRWSSSTGAGAKVEGGAGTQAWATVVDENTAKVYYAINYDTTPTIMQANRSGSGTPLSYLSTPYGVVAMAMKGDGSLVWVNGQRAGYSSPGDDSTINVVDPTDPTKSFVYTPKTAIKATSIWLVESPSTAVDPNLLGDGVVGSTYTCEDAVWEGDSPGARLSRQPQPGRAVAWYMDGVVVPGETDWTYRPDSGGQLKCTVTAENVAGSMTVESSEMLVIDPSTTTASPSTTIESKGSGSSESTTSLAPTTTTVAPASYKSISVKWSYNSSKKVLTASFKKVSGARTYGLGVTGATKKSVKCTTSGTKVTCKVTLKKGKNSITINARNAAKVIVAQKKASKTVR